MNLKKTLLAIGLPVSMSAASCLIASPTTKTPAEPNPKIISYAERPSAVYQCGEKVRFPVWFVIEPAKKYMDPPLNEVKIIPGVKIDYTLTGDGGLKTTGSIVSGKDPVYVEGALPRPGFILLNLSCDYNGKKIQRFAGAGVAPEKIVSGTKTPNDFDAFWANEIKEMRARKAKIIVRRAIEQETTETKRLAAIYDVRIEDGDINATGILSIPLYPKKKLLPARISFGGASWMGASPEYKEAAMRDVITFHMNIHDSENLIPNSKVNEVRNRPEISLYQFKNLADKQTYMPRKIFLRIIRCLDYLKSRPEWDKTTLIASGPSFGGCQAIVAAALDPDVTLCFPGAPAMCDHLGGINNQRAGWPQVLAYSGNNISAEVKKQAAENSAYFDTANMARKIKCPTVFSVGFIDPACPPTSVYAAYNNVPSRNKSMIHGTRAVHGDSTLASEPGAFSACDSPLYREALAGTEMLVNGNFAYLVSGVKKYTGKDVPWFWEMRGAPCTIKSEGPDKNTIVLSGDSKLFQSVWNIRRKACDITFTGKIRGNGTLQFIFFGAKPPVVQYVNASDEKTWTDFKHVYTVEDGAYALTIQLVATKGSVEIGSLSLNYSKQPE